MTTREELIYVARFTEQTERFEDMLEAMKKVVQIGQELSIDERNLLSVAYKNTIGSRRTAWRGLTSLEKRDEVKSPKNVHILKDYKKKLETELNRISNDILGLLDQTLIPGAKDVESQVFYHKMKGDYYRYMAEFTSDDRRKEAAQKSLEAYQKALQVAEEKLPTTHPIRLGLALNFSVFYFEILNEPQKACELAKKAFDEAIAQLDNLTEDSYKDSTVIMQLLRDNLTLWTSDADAEGDEDD